MAEPRDIFTLARDQILAIDRVLAGLNKRRSAWEALLAVYQETGPAPVSVPIAVKRPIKVPKAPRVPPPFRPKISEEQIISAIKQLCPNGGSTTKALIYKHMNKDRDVCSQYDLNLAIDRMAKARRLIRPTHAKFALPGAVFPPLEGETPAEAAAND